MGPEVTDSAQPLRSKHTSNLPALLEQLRISVLVTTYQAGKLVVLRSAGDSVNTHFRDLPRPMGLAADSARIAVGIAHEIREYRNMTPVCRRLEPPGRHDACYLARAGHVTGDIDIHEMAWAGDELWFVNTRFSCLCTLNGIHSFVPRWRPPFVTALAPSDRCHLNGLSMGPDNSGRLVPRYVTALAATDTPQGWREHKKDGGVLVDVPSGEIVVRGLSMPHSPRFLPRPSPLATRPSSVASQLWLLESGTGGLGYVDLAAGRYHNITELPGFTRGLDIFGNLAFVGLSQVRESAVFSGIPIAERALAERNCGVWVVDLRSGQTVAFLRFEDAVQEVFAVQVLPGLRYPEIAPEDPKLLADSYDLPSAALEDVPPALRAPAAAPAPTDRETPQADSPLGGGSATASSGSAGQCGLANNYQHGLCKTGVGGPKTAHASGWDAGGRQVCNSSKFAKEMRLFANLIVAVIFFLVMHLRQQSSQICKECTKPGGPHRKGCRGNQCACSSRLEDGRGYEFETTQAAAPLEVHAQPITSAAKA